MQIASTLYMLNKMIVYNINKETSEVYFRNKAISEIYIGNNKVFSKITQ